MDDRTPISVAEWRRLFSLRVHVLNLDPPRKGRPTAVKLTTVYYVAQGRHEAEIPALVRAAFEAANVPYGTEEREITLATKSIDLSKYSNDTQQEVA